MGNSQKLHTHTTHNTFMLGLQMDSDSSSIQTASLKRGHRRVIYSTDKEILDRSLDILETETAGEEGSRKHSAFDPNTSSTPSESAVCISSDSLQATQSGNWVISMTHEDTSPWCTGSDSEMSTPLVRGGGMNRMPARGHCTWRPLKHYGKGVQPQRYLAG